MTCWAPVDVLMSVIIAWTASPWRRHVSIRPSASRSAAITLAPASTKAPTIARPTPRAAPVTTATFVEKSYVTLIVRSPV